MAYCEQCEDLCDYEDLDKNGLCWDCQQEEKKLTGETK